MKWSTLQCFVCDGVLVVPMECAERVAAGESYVYCETCALAAERDVERLGAERP